MKRLIIFLFLAAFVSFAQDKSTNPQITKQEITDHLKYLASDALEGRLAGSKGNEEAAEYIRSQFEQAGLKPFYDGKYFQNFDFIQTIELGDNNSVKISDDNTSKTLELNKDFITAPFSGNADVNGELVFAGYGITSEKLGYDDYKNIDAKDKIVIVMRYNPEHDSLKSKFDRYSSLRMKASTARDAGAKGVIFINGYYPLNDEDELIEFKYDRGPQMNDFAAVHVKREIIDNLLKQAGYDLRSLQEKIDSTETPDSFVLTGSSANLTTDIKEIKANANNVAGYIEGNDPMLKNEYIVLGAHFDHLGWGIDGSLYRGDKPMVHNGADDNASGTTGLMELAEKFASVKDSLKRSIVFIAFNGEELGLLGSAYTVNHFPIDMENVDAMINMDMIGRLNDEKTLTIIGTGTSSIWKDLLNKDNVYDFNLKFDDAGFGGSDHQSFTLKNIPVLFFFTGIHEDYHKPSDDWQKINTTGEKNVLDYVYNIVMNIDRRTEKPDFVKVEREAPKGGAGYGKVYVGTVPEFGYQGEGFKLSGVSEGGPAQKAGLKGGDIMIKFGDKKIANIYDFMYAMNEHKPGDVVKVVVLRDGKEKEFDVTLESK